MKQALCVWIFVAAATHILSTRSEVPSGFRLQSGRLTEDIIHSAVILTVVWVTNFIFIFACRLLNLQNHNAHKYLHLLLMLFMNEILLSLTVMGELPVFSLRKKQKQVLN